MSVSEITELPRIPERQPDGHKGSYGRVLCVAGSRGMSGAAVLLGRSVLRAGAGLVEVASPREVQPIVAAGDPCYLTHGLATDTEGRVSAPAEDDLFERVALADCVAIGPGLGRSDDVRWLVRAVIERSGKPLVIDADALNSIAPLAHDPLKSSSPWVLTPHPGEFARLLDRPVEEILADREGLAVRFAAEHELTLVLKGHRSLVTDGNRLYRNPTGNPGMATGGTGDVLTGVIAALIGQGLTAFEAAQLGAYLHGLAGDLAAAELGQHSLTAVDVIEFLPHAFRQRLGT